MSTPHKPGLTLYGSWTGSLAKPFPVASYLLIRICLSKSGAFRVLDVVFASLLDTISRCCNLKK